MPPCNYFNETICMAHELYFSHSKLLKERYKCLKPKATMEYHGQPYLLDFRENINRTGLDIFFNFAREDLEIQEEMYVVSIRDFIASIGGSLGLFIGFSCYTYMACTIDTVFKKICNRF